MSKLHKLKKWITVTNAAEHLSKVFDEQLTVTDIYQFAIDGHLLLSVKMINPCRALFGDIVSFKGIRTVPSIDDENIKVCLSTRLDESVPYADSRYLNHHKETQTIDGIWDLHLGAGSAKTYLNRAIQWEDSGPNITGISVHGIYLTNELDEFAELYDDDDYPESELPDDCSIVVKVSALQNLILLANEANSIELETDSRTIHPRTESSYQRIIASLLSVIDGSIGEFEYENDSRLIEKLSDYYVSYPGLSKRNLEKKFPECRKMID
jgi:hypothetical protein